MSNKYGKKYIEASKLFEKKNIYQIDEAISLIKKTSITKFDSTVELVFRLNVDPRHADQQIRGALVLPSGTGNKKVILVLTNTKVKEAEEAKADFVGGKDLIEKIEKKN